jgi:hypothetical protein
MSMINLYCDFFSSNYASAGEAYGKVQFIGTSLIENWGIYGKK